MRENISHEDQLRRWVAGEPVHRHAVLELGDVTGGECELEVSECTPDFSCCKPELLAPAITRKAFVECSERDRNVFLGAFLAAAIKLAAPNASVRVLTDAPPDAA
jgi:hypothetical protein